MHTNTTKLLQR